MASTKPALVSAILQLLESDKYTHPEKREQLEVAIECISDAYKAELDELQSHRAVPLKLEDVFQKYIDSLQTNKVPVDQESSASELGDNLPGFDAFLSTLKHTKFFEGVQEGSPEYQQPNESNENKASTPTIRTATSTHDKREEAEKLKLEGNEGMRQGKYRDALQKYTAAIELDPTNAVYYSNRAAAKTHLDMQSSAIDDCKQAISLDPTFIRPRERLASAYFEAGMYEQAIETANQNPQFMQMASNVMQSGGLEQMFSQFRGNSERPDGQQNSGNNENIDSGRNENESIPGNNDAQNIFANLQNSPLFEQLNSNPQLRSTIESLQRDPNALMNIMNNPEILNAAMQSFQSLFGNHSGASEH
eukprot:jgi/Galph1/3477/GphlegSOOS_G2153.1